MMALVLNETESWDRVLGPNHLLEISAFAYELYCDEFSAVSIFVRVPLADGVELNSRSISELTADIAGIDTRAVAGWDLRISAYGTDAFSYAAGGSLAGSSGTLLRTAGRDATRVYGLHQRIRREIDKAFETHDLAESSKQKDVEQSGRTIFNGPVGTYVGRDLSGSSTTSQAVPKDGGSAAIANSPGDPPWWKNPWLVTIGGTLIAGLLTYLIVQGVI